jgi:5-methylcytosine-specific restriction endonuclease McrA
VIDPKEIDAKIDAMKTAKGAWTKAQLAEWGVSWPPRAGWRENLRLNGFPVDTSTAKPARVVDAPFITYAVPLKHGAVSAAYWQSDATVEFLTARFSQKSGKGLAKLAGEARLAGVVCRHCNQEIIAKNRMHAIGVLRDYEACQRYRENRMECDPCYSEERTRRYRERSAKWHGVEVPKPRAAPVQAATASSTPSVTIKEDFYRSWEWRRVRMEALIKHGQRCQCCGATPDATDMTGKPVRLCVDHIKPISKFWHLRLEPSNLQILCDECNQGKGNWDQTDFRKPADPDEWIVDDVGVSDAILAQLTDRTTGRLQ